MFNETMLRELREDADLHYQTLERALDTGEEGSFAFSRGDYQALKEEIRGAERNLGIAVIGFSASARSKTSPKTLQLMIEAYFAEGVVDGYMLRFRDEPNPDPNTLIDSLRQDGIALKRTGDILLANTQAAYRLGRILGYAGNANDVKSTFRQIKALQPQEAGSSGN
ncbi:hypothetical protein HY637_01550 [Candidatus Woesearchaeota archaeon]|nr:hypothetical protein [Candidatus Woesearchaeota archaeon]